MRLYDINGFKMEVDGEDIEHHGVIGQKWGRRRYQNPDGTLTELGKRRLQREQDRAIRKEEKYHAKVAKQRKKDIKAQEKATKKELKQVAKEQKEQEEIIEKKNKLVSKGSMEDIYKNRNLFTDQELQQVINRQRILNQLNPEASMTKRDQQFARAQEFVDKTAKTVKMTSDLFNAYKSASNIVNNLAGKEVLPEFDLAKKQQKAKDAKAKARAETIAKMTPDQIARNYSNFTTAELQDLGKREIAKKSLNAAREAYLNEREQQRNDSMFRGNKAYDFTATKNMLGDYGSQTYNTTTGFGVNQDISKGKSAVQSLLNEPEGALMSKWSPAPSATYKVKPESVISSSVYRSNMNTKVEDIPKPTKNDMERLYDWANSIPITEMDDISYYVNEDTYNKSFKKKR